MSIPAHLYGSTKGQVVAEQTLSLLKIPHAEKRKIGSGGKIHSRKRRISLVPGIMI